MGNRLAAFVSKPVRDFNIENRVDRVISAEKPKAAPRHLSDARHEPKTSLDDASRVQEKREDLLERLRSVKVVSSDPQVQASAAPRSDRPLPQSREAPLEQKYGYFEPTVVPRGRLTLRQATQMLADVKMDPATYTPEAVAAQYGLDVKDVHSMLRYFGVFRVHSVQPTQQDFTGIGHTKSALLSLKQSLQGDSKEEQKADEHTVGTQDDRTLGTKK
uniref:NADH dehydrogenase [ubiquinone] 1 alpha subcomplex assembly factor 4 n=1 Tax=Hyalomma excavatum TaxID=257692 RepID=A0A131XIR9_9ACAR